MQRTIWTVLGVIVAAVALFPMASQAGILDQHNESLVRDTAAK